MSARAASLALAAVLAVGRASSVAAADSRETLTLRGCPQTLHLYGARGGPAAIVTSGDGGWVHLGPQVADFLAGAGYYVVGFDAKAYLSSFTSRSGPLAASDVPGDYASLLDFVGISRLPPLLVGVSEGAGLSVLAATDPAVKARVAGVVALGLPDRNELAWRWRDALIYVTKKTPNEPTFSTRALVDKLAPLPLALVHSTHDEFVPRAEIEDILARAGEPKRLFMIEAADHRFSDQQGALWRRLGEAIDWIRADGRSGN